MQHDVFDHHNGIVDDQPNRCRQSAKRHQVECLPHQLQNNKRHQYGDRDNQSCNQRSSPVAEEKHQDDGRQNQAE